MVKDIFLSMSVLIALFSTNAFSQPENQVPIVKILDPLTNTKHDLNDPLRYRINVSDQEDGESKYDEIAANEVFLEVKYFPNTASIMNSVLSTIDHKGLAAMKKSNCFTCHAFKGKLIAPSFHDIAKRYAANANIELLAKHIQAGSTGVWGTTSMPTHQELTPQEAHDMVTWILENAKDPNLNYYIGIEGNIKLNVPEGTHQKGAFKLSATYSDHGSKNNPKESLTSNDVIVVYVK